MNERQTLIVSKGRCRVVIKNVPREIKAARFGIKRVAGERVMVEADIFADAHDAWAAVLKYRAGTTGLIG